MFIIYQTNRKEKYKTLKHEKSHYSMLFYVLYSRNEYEKYKIYCNRYG